LNHLILAPILLPAITAILLLLTARADRMAHRAGSVLSLLATAGVAGGLAWQAGTGPRQVYAMGAWPLPHGIVLVLDPLSATFLVLTAALALGALLFASQGWDQRGRNFHAIFQFQLMGLNGAFLTGDIFNLFVFFEILLIASYGLLLHGGGARRVRAGLHYVVLNLVGSALFLVGLALVYGGAGTLNMADLIGAVAHPEPADTVVLTAAGLTLLIVFSIKAAAVPLQFWLPGAYASASAPVACLFAIMTKVGLYAILRVHGVVFGLDGALLAKYAPILLLIGGVVTLAVGAVGALASRSLKDMLAWLVISSVGTALIALGHGGPHALTAALYYIVHSTLVAGAMFLLADLIAQQRGPVGDALRPGPVLAQPNLLGGLFLVGAATMAGLPPTSGFLGKVAVLRAAALEPYWSGLVFAAILIGGLLALVTLSRAGSALFWNLNTPAAPDDHGHGHDAHDHHTQPPATDAEVTPTARPARLGELVPVLLLLGLSLALAAAGGPAFAYMESVAASTLDRAGYAHDVFAAGPEPVERVDGHGGAH
jgi:multicomponent K+:H+ antiporter subunit D